jgi:hypothetical protein
MAPGEQLMTDLQHILQKFDSISLEEMDAVRLMSRTDTKFMLHRADLKVLLEELSSTYRVLEVAGSRMNHYQTLYYDTQDFRCYAQHHNGKRNRFKIRKREYMESHLSFLEFKEKTNKGRTVKSRIKLQEINEDLSANENAFIDQRTGKHSEYEPKLWNSFTRITLVDMHARERLTIDTDIAFREENRKASLPELVIVEVKRDEKSGKSAVLHYLKHRLIRPESMSKYCLGVALLYPEMKRNNFKQKLAKIDKIKLAYVA